MTPNESRDDAESEDLGAFEYTARMLGASDLQAIAVCIGFAALWVCLQASGFYPLSVLDHAGVYPAQHIARYHLAYTVVLIVLAAAAMIAHRHAGKLLEMRWFLAAAGLAGAAGHLLLATSRLADGFSPTVLLAVVLVGFFIVVMTLFWPSRLAGNDSMKMLLYLAVSYLISQFACTIYAATGLAQGYLLVACSAANAACACAVGSGNLAAEEEGTRTRSIRKLPWGMLVPALFLIYFCEIFIRLRIGAYGGDVSVERRMLTSLIAGGAFTVVAAVMVLARKQDTERNLMLSFAVLVLAYLVALIFMLVTGEEGHYYSNRVLIACSHCVEVFIWMLVLIATERHALSPITTFGFLAIVALAVPWALSFDLYYLTGLDAYFGSRDILVAGISIGLIVAAAGTILYLLSYAMRLPTAAQAAAPTPAPQMSTRELVRTTLEPFGLTQREYEVAEYLYRGYSAKKTAENLFLSEASIRAYTMHIYRKMDIHSKQELISYIDEHKI